MKRIVSSLMLVVILFTTLVCTTSCGAEDEGAQISVYLADPIYGFDPAGDYIDDTTISVLHMIYEPLFTLDEKGKVQKAMAEDYEYDKDKGVLTITLRESYWTSGSQVTAADFVYAWQRIIDHNNSFACAPLLYEIKNAIEIKTAAEGVSINDFGAVAMDNLTLEITFADKDVDLDGFLRTLTSISLAPVARDAVLNQEEYWSNGSSTQCYTNGPFKVNELDYEDGKFTLARHAGYHRGPDSKKDEDHYVIPSMIRTIWNVDPEVSHAETLEQYYDLLENGAENTIFYMNSLSLADRAALKDKAEVFDNLSTYTYVFDNSNPLFADSRVRVILSKVIDRNSIANMITFGTPANGLISNGVWDSTSGRENKSFRNSDDNVISSAAAMTVDEANEALNAIGAERGEFTITVSDREEELAIAEYVAWLWGLLGYTVHIEPVTYYVIMQDAGADDVFISYNVSALKAIFNRDVIYDKNGNVSEKLGFDVIGIDYQMYTTNAFAALAGLSSNLSGAGVDLVAYNLSVDPDKKVSDFYLPNFANYENEAYDALILAAARETDLEKRAEILHQAEEMLMADMPVLPLIFNQSYYVKHKNLRHLDVNYYGFTVFTRAKLRHYDEYFF